MDYLLRLLNSLIGDAQLVRIVFVSLTALAVAALSIGASVVALRYSHPLRRRLARLVGEAAPLGLTPKETPLIKLSRRISRYVVPKNETERSRLGEQLIHAGYRTPDALALFYASKTLLAVLLPVGTLILLQGFPALAATRALFLTAVAGFIGLVGPNVFLARKIEHRQRILCNGFPDALDLLVVCVEAGLGLAAALQRVANELITSHPELAEELALVNTEIRAGVDRITALKNLAQRTGLEDIRGLVTVLAQSMRFGTSVAETLRVYSEEFRDKRMQRAEEQAAKIGTKMIFPLAFCLFPSFFLVAIGPAVLRVLEAFGTMGWHR